MNEDAARVKMYGMFDQYGRALGFYPDDIYPPNEDGSRNEKIPADAVEITLEQWQELLAKQPFAAYVDGEVKVLSAPVPTALVEMEPPQPSPFDKITEALADISTRLAALEKKAG